MLNVAIKAIVDRITKGQSPVLSSEKISKLVKEVSVALFKEIPVYADSTAAKAAGLEVGDPYKTSTGAVFVVQ